MSPQPTRYSDESPAHPDMRIFVYISLHSRQITHSPGTYLTTFSHYGRRNPWLTRTILLSNYCSKCRYTRRTDINADIMFFSFQNASSIASPFGLYRAHNSCLQNFHHPVRMAYKCIVKRLFDPLHAASPGPSIRTSTSLV